MKDELEELTTDASTRKTATDWLMQVISGKKPINLHLNSADPQEEVTAVAEREVGSGPATAAWAREFTAEDLCGAPAVPIVRAPSASDFITADDVCWVPEPMRLKPQPAATELVQPPPAPNAPKVLRMGQMVIREAQPQIKVPEPEPRKATTTPVAEFLSGRTALAADPALNHESLEEFVSMADISREPAPYVVEQIPGSYSDHSQQSAIEDKPVTAADIARDWVIQSMESAPGREKDGVVLPFSFKVLKSSEVVHPDAQPEADGFDAAPADTTAAEAQAVMQQTAPEPVLNPEEAIATESEEAALEMQSSPAVSEKSAAAPTESEAVTAVPEELSSEPMQDEVPATAADEAVPEENDSEMEFDSELLEVQAALSEMESGGTSQFNQQPAAIEAAQSIFAHEGIWEKDSQDTAGNGDAREPLNSDLQVQHPFGDSEVPSELGNRPEGWISAWKTLLRLGSVLPWVAKALPALESGAWNQEASGPAQEMRQDIAGLRLVQYEIRTTVQDHTLQLKRVEEQLSRMRELMEAKSPGGEMAENVRSMARLVRVVGLGLGGLMAVLIVLLLVLLAHGR